MTTKEKLKKIHEAMHKLNAFISFNHIALQKPLNAQFLLDINRMMGEWIKQIRDIEEEME